MITPIRILCLLLVASSVYAQPKAYNIFNHKGKSTSYTQMLKELESADIVFFGELHNNPICHWLELEVTRDLYAQESENLILGAEMFEADDQLLLNEYCSGLISEKNFTKETKIWPNYATDYSPLVSFAKENNLSFIATNIPRRYASIVFKKGLKSLDNLPEYSKIFIAPLPIQEDYDVECYKAMLEMDLHGMTENPKYYPQAQMIKDATMAYFIHGNWSEGELFLHFNGAYHSNNKEGIIWYLRQINPNLKIVTINTVEQKNVEKLEQDYTGTGDFILAIPDRMTKTY